ncbi:hypothetical protein LINPERHAP2_LOCUS3672 [Linum perenne]
MSDSLSLVTILNNGLRPWPWECNVVGAQMVPLLDQSPWIRVEFVPRTRNLKADWVANETRKRLLLDDWLGILNDVQWR